MKLILAAVFLILNYFQLFSQIKVVSEKNEPLEGSNIYFPEMKVGFGSDEKGNITVKNIKPGTYRAVTRFLGYKPDTSFFRITENGISPDKIVLKQNDLMFQTVTIYGENYTRAELLLLAAIEAKKDRNKDITSLTFEGYHRFKFMEDKMVKTKKGDSTLLQFPPQETISRNFWTADKGIFRTITQQKLIPLMSFDLQQFYAKTTYYTLDQDQVFIGSQSFKSPLADDGVEFYLPEILDSSMTENGLIYKLSITPRNPADLGFQGTLEIDSKSYNPTRFIAGHNKPISGFFLFAYSTDITFGQVEQRAWLPVKFVEMFKVMPFGITDSIGNYYDYRTNLTSFYSNYQFNQPADVDLNKVNYVNNLHSATDTIKANFTLIPYTETEKKVLHALDSMSRRISFMNLYMKTAVAMMNFPKYPVTGFSDFIRYNKVEGLALGFGYRPKFSTEPFQYEIAGGYAFGAEIPWMRLSADYYFKQYLNFHIGADFLNGMKTRNYFGYFRETSSTLSSLFARLDPFDYYRTTYLNPFAEIEPAENLKLKLGWVYEEAKSVSNSVNFSLSSSPKSFSPNPKIKDGKFQRIKTTLTYDNRKYNDMFFSRTPLKDKLTLFLQLDFETSEPQFLSTDSRFWQYTLNAEHEWFFWRDWFYSTRVTGYYGKSSVPVQQLVPIATRVGSYGNSGTFVNLPFNSFGGTKQVQGIFEIHTLDFFIPFSSSLPGWLGKPDLIVIHQMTFTENPRTADTNWSSTFDKPYGETGFALGNIFGSFRFDFMWTTQSINGINGFGFKFGSSMTL